MSERILRWNNKPLTLNSKLVRVHRTIPTDYLGYWKFEGNSNDETGNYNGTNYSTPTYSANGIVGQCINYNNSYTTTALSSQNLMTGTYPHTASAWFKTSANAQRYFLGGTKTDSAGFVMGLVSGTQIRYSRDGAYSLQPSISYSVADSRWHHMVGRYNGTTMDVWLDGLMIQAVNPDPATATYYGPITFGRMGSYTSLYWVGALDQVRIYNYALSNSAIRTLYTER